MTTITPERIADLVKRLSQMAVDLSNCDTLPRQHRDTQYEIDAAIVLCREAADALSTPPPAEGVTEHEDFAKTVLDWWEECFRQGYATSWDAGELRKRLRTLASKPIAGVETFANVLAVEAIRQGQEALDYYIKEQGWSEEYARENAKVAFIAEGTPIAAPDEAELREILVHVKKARKLFDGHTFTDDEAEAIEGELDKALAALSRAARPCPTIPDDTNVQALLKELAEPSGIGEPHDHALMREAAELLRVTDYGYRKICEKNDELQTLCGELTKALRVRPTSTERDKAFDAMREAVVAFVAWLDAEDSRPNYGSLTRDTHPEGERIWREWWDRNLRLCEVAHDSGRAALALAELKQKDGQ